MCYKMSQKLIPAVSRRAEFKTDLNVKRRVDFSRKESTALSTDVDDMKLRMFSKFRDFKDKMEQHKENVPKIFGKK